MADPSRSAGTGAQDAASRPSKIQVRSSDLRPRVRDAARVLPFVGIFLIFLPVLWRPATTAAKDTAPATIYLFSVWFGLICAAFLLSRLLARAERAPDDDAGEGRG